MTPILLIAGNFLREQRWFIFFLVLYVVAVSSVYALTPRPEMQDFLFLVKQLTAFALLFSVSAASSAIHNERRSRRIVAVLSKGISRSEYIGGLLLGSLCISAISCAGLLVGALELRSRLHFPLEPVLALAATTLVAAVLINAIGLFFATFFHPLLAMVATAVVISFPFVLSQVFGPQALHTLAAAPLIDSLRNFSFSRSWSAPWFSVGVALIESVLFWLASAWVFSRRDVAVAVE